MNIFKRVRELEKMRAKIDSLDDMVRTYRNKVEQIGIELKQDKCKHENIEFLANRTPNFAGITIVYDEQFYSKCADCGIIIDRFGNNEAEWKKAKLEYDIKKAEKALAYLKNKKQKLESEKK